MNDMNWKTWAIIFIIAMGAGLEAIKRLPGNSRLVDEQAGIPGTTPYAVKMKNAPMVIGDAPRTLAPKAVVVGGQTLSRETLEKFIAANKPEATDFDKVLKGMADKNAAKKKKSKDGDEWEIVVDPKTGKRYKRKKKKGAKAEKKKEEDVAKQEEPKKPEPKKDDMKIEDLMAETIQTGQLPPPPNRADTPFADLEEWKRRLLTQPDASETRTFIDHYKNNLVSADIFYKITQMMIEDSRPEMKELGILCAGSTPSSMSFTLLAEVHNTERSGSSTRTYADGFLGQYANAGNLNILQQVMQSPADGSVAILATQKVDVAAQSLLAPSKNKNKTPASGTNSTSTTQGSTQTHSNAAYFKPFLTILQTMSRGKDASVVAQAKSTLSNLQRLMYPNSNPNPPQTTQIQASAQRF
jgi:hypothetical protein